jgi:hypothetical protein
MQKLLNALKLKGRPKQNQFYSSMIAIVEEQDISTIKWVSENTYTLGNATVLIKYFDPDCYEEMQLSFGYSTGKGFSVVIRNYGEHLIVINHEIFENFHTYEFILSPDSFVDKDYRSRLDIIADKIIMTIEGINKRDNSA